MRYLIFVLFLLLFAPSLLAQAPAPQPNRAWWYYGRAVGVVLIAVGGFYYFRARKKK